VEAAYCAGEEVVIVGGGNSAGQAAVFLAGHARHVYLVVRADGLAASMPQYLIRRIEGGANITLHVRTEIVALEGDSQLTGIQWRQQGASAETMALRHLFLFLGAEPSIAWLGDCVALDGKSFVQTGAQIPPLRWPLQRPQHYLETSRPGIFATGRCAQRLRQAPGRSRRRRFRRRAVAASGAGRARP
jgi:thioredoxin reductase (NADPH)